MTPEQQRIAIAKACPDLFIHVPSPFGPGGLHWKIGQDENGNTVSPGARVDPLSDLNAMHEAEKVLKDDQMDRYWLELNGLLNVWARGRRTWVFESPANIRAQAFLRTLELWKDDASHLNGGGSDYS